jgi:hypothetical protein
MLMVSGRCAYPEDHRVARAAAIGEMIAAQRETFGTAQGKRTDLGFEKTQVG